MIRNIEPYLSEDIEYQTSLARGGDFNSTYNLLVFFCSCIKRGNFPPLMLSTFVAEILEKNFSENKKNNLYRNKEIHDAMNQMASLRRHSSLLFRSMEIGNKKGCSISKATKLEKCPPNTSVFDFCDAARKNELNEDLLKNVLPAIHKIIKSILNPGDAGKAQRYKLELKRYGEWNSSEEAHKEILQDIERYGVTATAKNLNMKVNSVRKIWKRKNTLKGGQ